MNRMSTTAWLVVSLLSISSGSLAVAGSPHIGEELLLQDPAFSGEEASFRDIQGASSRDLYLLVTRVDYPDRAVIEATRIDVRTGIVLDLSPIEVAEVYGTSPTITVTSNGEDFLVGFTCETEGQVLSENVYAVRLDGQTGELLDTGWIALDTSEEVPRFDLAASSNGSSYLVAWASAADYVADLDIHGALLDAGGNLLAGEPADGGLLISSAPGSQLRPDIASNGQDYLVIWQDVRKAAAGGGVGDLNDIYGARIRGSDGAILDEPDTGLSICDDTGNQYRPQVAANGPDLLVAWDDTRDHDCWGRRLYWDSESYSADAIQVLLGSPYWDQQGCRVAYGSGEFLVTGGIGEGHEAVRVRFLEEGMEISQPTGFFAKADELVGHPEMVLAAWLDNSQGVPSAAYARRVETTRETIGGLGWIDVSQARADQRYPSVASNGNTLLVVWQDGSSGSDTGWDLYGIRLDARSGAILDSTPLPVATAEGNQILPAVASDGQDFLVAWQDDRHLDTTGFDIYGVRLDADTGEPLDGEPSDGGLPICTAPGHQRLPRVAHGNGLFAIAWEEVQDLSGPDIRLARVTAVDGQLLDGPPESGAVVVSAGTAEERSPDLAWDGEEFFVVWQDGRSGASVDIMGARIDPDDGTVLDGPTDGTGGIPIATAPGDQQAPRIAMGEQYLFALWSDPGMSSDYPGDIRGTRIDGPAGSVLDGPPGDGGLVIMDTDQSESRPLVVFDDHTFYAIWIFDFLHQQYHAVTSRLDESSGGLLDAIPYVDEGAMYLVDRPVHLSMSEAYLGVSLLTYEQHERVTGYRILGRFLTNYIPPVAVPGEANLMEDTPATVTLDGYDPAEDPITFAIVDNPQVGELSGLVPETGEVTYWTYPNFVGTDWFTFRTNDGIIDSPPARFTIHVLPANDPPFWVDPTPTGPLVADEGIPLEFTVSARDIDGPEEVHYGAWDLPGTMSLDALSGEVDWVPAYTDGGSHDFDLYAFDGIDRTVRRLTVAVTVVDDDSDGLPDTWEGLTGTDPERDDAGEDPDGDGLTNLEEWLGGTAPTVSDAPGAPDLLSPAEGERVRTVKPWLLFDQAIDPNGDDLTYEVAVASGTDPGVEVFFADQLVAQEDGTVEIQVDTDLVEEASYTWHARAFDGAGFGPWAADRSFVVDAVNDAPLTPTLLSPVDGSTVADLQPLLQIGQVVDRNADAVTYHFLAGEQGTAVAEYTSGPISPPDSGTVTWQVPEPLMDGSEWWWTAHARDERGLDGQLAVAFTFMVDDQNQPPDTPELIAPIEGAVVTTSRPTLRVEAVEDPEGDPVRYRLLLSPGEGFPLDELLLFEDLQAEQGEVALMVPVPLADGAWYWGAMATDGRAYSEMSYSWFAIRTQPMEPEPDAGPDADPDLVSDPDIMPDEGGDPDIGEPDAEEQGDLVEEMSVGVSGGEGCGCAATERSHPGSTLWLVVVIAVLLRRWARAARATTT